MKDKRNGKGKLREQHIALVTRFYEENIGVKPSSVQEAEEYWIDQTSSLRNEEKH